MFFINFSNEIIKAGTAFIIKNKIAVFVEAKIIIKRILEKILIIRLK